MKNYNRTVRKILFQHGLEMLGWDDAVLAHYFGIPAEKARKNIADACKKLANQERERIYIERERKLREFENNLPF